jgi:FMN phosphatase YigB (HAD superfamily)
MKAAFKTAYKERCIESPCFGGVQGIAGRDWWRETVKRVLVHSGRSPDSEFSEHDFDRYFRRVYQHFGSPKGYLVLDDAHELLNALERKAEMDHDSACLLLGITSNTPTRHMESVLPMLGIHDHFQWFTCSQEVGAEKPSTEIFEDAFTKAKFWIPDLQKHQVLHIGDSLACDFCGAKAFGFEALLLDRSENPAVTSYQDWIEAPDYPGKSEEDVEQNTITNLLEVLDRLEVHTLE